MRVDFNVPYDENHTISDNTRIVSSLESIKKIIGDGGKLILMSHFGRPNGEISEKYSLKEICNELSRLLAIKVNFCKDCIGEEAKKASLELKEGEVLLLENLRFYKQEELGEVNFAKELASLGDFYVNDAFGTAHRAHASTAVIAKFFPDAKCFGYLMEKEIKALNQVLKSGNKPITAILGGAKVSSKISIIKNILKSVDHIIIGGGMTYTFIKAKGGQIGNSIVEKDYLNTALEILKEAEKTGVKIHLPLDSVIADDFSENANVKESEVREIPNGWEGVDIGSKSRDYFNSIINQSKTILWNGPMGVFEIKKFSYGTKFVANSIKEATLRGAFSLVGGGDSIAAVKKFGFEKDLSYISTGGGAMLESLEGKILPGIKAILD